MFPRNHHEIDNPDGDETPRCDLRWSKDCDHQGINFLDPEFACALCWALCEECQEAEWHHQYGGKRLCENCLQHAAEAAYERQCEDYYGGGEPVTVPEQYAAAAEWKARHR